MEKFEAEAIKRAKKIPILDREDNFASPEDVIIHKIFAGRPRDIEDVRVILLKNPQLNIKYIKDWLVKFDEFSDKRGNLISRQDFAPAAEDRKKFRSHTRQNFVKV